MKKIVKIALLAAVVVSLSPAHAASEADYKAAHAAAVASLDKAKKVGGEWRDSRWKKSKAVKVKGKDGKAKKTSLLGAAEAYAKMGDYKKAVKYAEKAKFQGDRGYEQAMQQKNAGPRH